LVERAGEVWKFVALGPAFADADECGLDREFGKLAGEAGLSDGLITIIGSGPGAVWQGAESLDQRGREEAVGAGLGEDGADVSQKNLWQWFAGFLDWCRRELG
jgi:hypothetical protein